MNGKIFAKHVFEFVDKRMQNRNLFRMNNNTVNEQAEIEEQKQQHQLNHPQSSLEDNKRQSEPPENYNNPPNLHS